MRHISGHCGHSEAHYKHLHIINNIMIKMPTVKMQDEINKLQNALYKKKIMNKHVYEIKINMYHMKLK